VYPSKNTRDYGQYTPKWSNLGVMGNGNLPILVFEKAINGAESLGLPGLLVAKRANSIFSFPSFEESY
jgi:hypothetical protein